MYGQSLQMQFARESLVFIQQLNKTKNINQNEVGRQYFHFEVWQSTWCQVLSFGPKSSLQKWQSINNSVIDRFEIREVDWGYHDVKQPVISLITILQDCEVLLTHELRWCCVCSILERFLAVSDTALEIHLEITPSENRIHRQN